jgi:ethanolamine utilization protein EutP (predicted NTPase)
MNTSISKFDPIEYAKQLRNVGVTQEQAEVQAQAIEKIIADITTNQELVTKRDLAELKIELVTKRDLAELKIGLVTKSDLAEFKLEVVKWVLGVGVSTILALAGILKLMVN